MKHQQLLKKYSKSLKTIKNQFSNFVQKLDNIKKALDTKNPQFEILLQDLNKFSKSIDKIDLFFDQVKKIVHAFETIKKWGNLANYPNELYNFRRELKKYGPSVFLWVERKFPHISEVQKLLGWRPPFLLIRNIEEIVNQYHEIILMVKSRYPQIYTKEFYYSRKFFKNEIKPINFATENYPIYKKVNTILMTETIGDVKKFMENLPELINVIEERGFLEVKKNHIPINIKNLSKKMEKTSKKVEKSFAKLNSDFEITANLLLNQIQAFDSFNLNVIKFLLRLSHILKRGNRNYNEKISLEKEYTPRWYLRKNLKNDILNGFSDLSRFLLKYMDQFEKFRHIRSHRTPKLKVSKNKKYFLIYNPVNDDFLRVHIEQTKKYVITFAFFIRALNL